MIETKTNIEFTNQDFLGFENHKLELSNISKVYPTPKGNLVLFENFNLKITEGQFVSIIGKRGCGKSTLLSMIAGLNPITSGQIILDGNPISGPGPDRAVVFQSTSLLPWMTALQNVQSGIDKAFAHQTKNQREDISKYYLNKVGLGDAFDKEIKELSPGMKQRLAIARALALKPQILLLDKPFETLDLITRADLQNMLLEVLEAEKITTLMITYNVDEAILLSDKVVMMSPGPKAQITDTLDIAYNRPRNKKNILENDSYYSNREYLINFLEQ